MSDNSLKTPLAASLNSLAQRRALDAIQLTGKALPCSVVSVSGAIVTVKFEVTSTFTLPQIAVPLFGPVYIRYPIQGGDKGMVIAADARLGGMSGLGGGTADLSAPGNLSALVFLPIGNTDWSSVDPNSVNINGPNGVVLRDTTTATTFILTPTSIAMVAVDEITMIVGSTKFDMTAAGITITGNLTVNGLITGTEGFDISGGTGATAQIAGNLTASGEITAGSIPLSTHHHGGVQTGGGNTGGPAP